jgi:hypothetical protein
MSSLDGTLRVRPVQLGDQECIRILLSGLKLPLEGLENAKMWVLQTSTETSAQQDWKYMDIKGFCVLLQ